MFLVRLRLTPRGYISWRRRMAFCDELLPYPKSAQGHAGDRGQRFADADPFICRRFEHNSRELRTRERQPGCGSGRTSPENDDIVSLAHHLDVAFLFDEA